MSPEGSKALERSVDSIQRIYAVVIALAISEAMQTFLKVAGGVAVVGDARPALEGLVAFLVTLVPFWHGMNRHLDRSYLEKASQPIQGWLLFDFAIFLIDAGLLFTAGASLGSGMRTFYCLGLLLLADACWGLISHRIHRPHEKSYSIRWAVINFVTVIIACSVVIYLSQHKALVLAVIATGRSIADYWSCRDFYFPKG